MSDDDDLRDGYDRLATRYADELGDELDGKPLDRWLLDTVAREAPGELLDVGCGPGHVSAYLAARGATVRGLDLSPQMIAVARARVPAARFAVGDLRALPDADRSLGGVVAMYALCHLPGPALAPSIAELARVVAPGGLLLVAVHAGTDVLRPDALWDIPIAMSWHFHDPDAVVAAIAATGLAPRERLVRWPYDGAEHASRRCYVLAQRPR